MKKTFCILKHNALTIVAGCLKKNLPFIYLVLLVNTTQFYGQKSLVTDDDIALAVAIKTDMPDEDIAILSSADYVTFNFDKNANQVTATTKKKEQIIAIGDRGDIRRYMFYDGMSAIENFEILRKNKKKAAVWGRIRDEAYERDDLFHNDSRVKWINLNLPSQGFQYIFKATKLFKDVKYFTSLYFNDEFFTKEKTITVVIPDWLTLELKEMNFEGYSIVKTETNNPDAKNTTITYTVENLAPMSDEKSSLGPSHIYPHLVVLAKSYLNKAGETKKLFKETSDLYAWYKSLVDTMNDDPTFLQSKVEELTQNATTDEEKIKKIYYWVQDNIRYIAFEDGIAGFKPDESHHVFKKRYGDCKGMANLTKQMLKLAGFDARLTWIGTKRIAYDYSTPSLLVDNHMICTLIKDGQHIFLDGTEKFNSYGEYAERIQGKQVMIENGADFILDRIPSSTANTNIETYTFSAEIIDNTLTGKAHRTYAGESRASFLYYYNNLKSDKKEAALSYYLNNGDKNLTVSEIKTSDLENRDHTLSIDYLLNQDHAIARFDDELYIDLDYAKDFINFDLKERETAYVFPHKTHFNTAIKLRIPGDMKIKKIPENLSVDTEDFQVKITFTHDKDVLDYSKQFIFKNAMIQKKNIAEWNETLEAIKAIYNEQLILIKK